MFWRDQLYTLQPLPFKKLLRKWWPSHSTVGYLLFWGVASLLSFRAFRRGAYPECLRPQLWSCLGYRTHATCCAARRLGFTTSCKKWRCGWEVSQWSLGPFPHAMAFCLFWWNFCWSPAPNYLSCTRTALILYGPVLLLAGGKDPIAAWSQADTKFASTMKWCKRTGAVL